MNSKHVSMWIIHILNWSVFAEKKKCSWDKRKEIGQIFYEEIKFDKHLYECLITYQSEKKYIWNWSKIISIFHFFHWFFYENNNQEHNLLPGCAFGPFLLMYVVKIICQASFPSVF